MWITTAIFKKFLRVLNRPIGVQVKNILLFEDNCATYLQDRSSIRVYAKFVYDVWQFHKECKAAKMNSFTDFFKNKLCACCC